MLELDPELEGSGAWDRAGVARRRSQRAGASGDRRWATPARRARRGPPGAVATELVDEAVERAAGRRRVRQALGMPSDRRISNEVIDELLAGASTEEEIAGPGGLLAQLTKRLVERAMEVELTDHVGYEPHQRAARRRARTSATARRRRR